MPRARPVTTMQVGAQLAAFRPAPVSEGLLRQFVRGKERPRGVVWFGARSFWGHVCHLIAAGIAAENIDSRDWMKPDEPDVLRARIVETLGGSVGADAGGATLVEALGRDLYIDFVADTGDDVAVSRAVARLVFAPYELPDPDRPGHRLTAPRGDILFFGGDTAYPVATAQEILNRVIVPWNQVLRGAARRRAAPRSARHSRQSRLVRRARRLRAHVPPPRTATRARPRRASSASRSR